MYVFVHVPQHSAKVALIAVAVANASTVPSATSPTAAPIEGLTFHILRVFEDCLQLLATGFLRGGIGGFLKGSTAHAATAGGSREVRIGVALVRSHSL